MRLFLQCPPEQINRMPLIERPVLRFGPQGIGASQIIQDFRRFLQSGFHQPRLGTGQRIDGCLILPVHEFRLSPPQKQLWIIWMGCQPELQLRFCFDEFRGTVKAGA